jgi:hypothetical protein
MISGDNNRLLVLVCPVVREGVKGKRFPLPETLSFSSKAVHLFSELEKGLIPFRVMIVQEFSS